MSFLSLLRDAFGFQGEFSVANDLRVAQPYRLTGTAFGSAIDTNFWTAVNSGTASAAGVAVGMATLASGTANSGYGQISTVRVGRFIFDHTNNCRCIVRIPELTKANCTRRWGAFTLTGTTAPLDGFYFSLSGTDVLSVNCIANGGTPTSVASGSFNGSVASYAVDTNAHVYEIHYLIAGIFFFIDGVLIHTFKPTTVLLAQNMHHNFVATAINSAGGTVSGTIELWAGMILRLGRNVSTSKFFNITTASTNVLKLGPGTLRRIIINKAAGTTITIYDNTSAASPIIGVIGNPANNNPLTLDYDLDFQTGLTIVTTGTWDLTVTYE